MFRAFILSRLDCLTSCFNHCFAATEVVLNMLKFVGEELKSNFVFFICAVVLA